MNKEKLCMLVTHNDFDAAGCAIVYYCWRLDQEDEGPLGDEVIYCSNFDVDIKIQEAIDDGRIGSSTKLLMADICCSINMLETLKTFKKEGTILVFDHHKTNLSVTNILDIYTKIYCDPDSEGKRPSGASILFQELKSMIHHKECNFLLLCDVVEKARSYDTFQWKDTNDFEAKELQTLFFLLGMERFVNRYVSRIKTDWYATDKADIFIPVDKEFVDAKIEQEQRNIDGVTPENIFTFKIKGYKTAVKFQSGGMNISELSHQFLSKYTDYDMFIGVNLGEGSIAFRTSRTDLDTGFEFARNIIANGRYGGGHPQASGCGIPNELRLEIINRIVDLISDQKEYVEINKL